MEWIPVFFSLIMLICIILLASIAKSKDIKINQLEATVAATQQTGIYGDRFQVTLSDGRVVVAGVIMSAEEANNYFYEFRDGKDVVIHRPPDVLVGDKPLVREVMSRLHARLGDTQQK